MVCKHQISLCSLHGCEKCDHAGNESSCPFAYVASLDEAYPTFAQMFEVYLESGKHTRHKTQVVASVRDDISRVGLTIDSRCTEMTRSKFKSLMTLLTAPLANGSVLRGATIQSHLAAFRSISSDWLEDRYDEKGFELPCFSIPKFHQERMPVQEVSDRTIRKVEIEMEKWLATGKESDRSAFIFCFFALYCGMRAGDICAATWNVIKRTTAGVMLVYKPHKTADTTGATVSFLLDNKTFCKIEPLVGNADEFVIPRHEEKIPEGRRKKGHYNGMHLFLRRKVNRMLSICGIGNDYRGQKKTHALRKYFETDRAMSYGKLEAANACGHSVRIQERNYLGTAIGKVS